MTRLERMVTRARVVRAYYTLREQADDAAVLSALARNDHDEADAEFHSGRQAAFLGALGVLDKVLADD